MSGLDVDTVQGLCGQARFGRKQPAASRDGMVVTSHPVATRIGVETLRAGGKAVDAALAAAVAQTVVEPHMSTVCGVLSLLHHDVASGATTYLNGSMNAPLEPLPGFSVADLATGRGVAVPGFPAAFEDALTRLGSKSKAEVVAPAIQLARQGFPIYPFLYGMLFEQAGRLGHNDETRELFFDSRGGLKNPGDLLVQHRLADTLERFVDDGSEYFYRGAWAQRFVDVVRGAGGVLTRADLDRYQTRWLQPAWGTYRGHRVAGSPPPDNGGTHIIEILNLVEALAASWPTHWKTARRSRG